MRNKQFTWTSSIAARSSGESLTALRWLIIPQTIANWSVIFSNGSTNFGHDGSTVLSNSSKSLSYKDTVKKQPSQIKKDQTLINPWTETNKDFYIIYNTKQNPEIKTWKKKQHTRFFRRARIPGRTCLCSTTSKGGNSKSCNKGLDSSTTVAIEIVGGVETEEEE
jgi:hypothetical protein